MTSLIKYTDVAGQFYPADKKQLEQMLGEFINDGVSSSLVPKAIIAPHAGYIYSGPVAGSIYKTIQNIKEEIHNVVVLSPSHRFYLEGLACHSADFFQTPLGDLAVNKTMVAKMLKLSQVKEEDGAFDKEHGLETHLPFVHKLFGEKIKIVPLIVGACSEDKVAEVLELFWEDKKTFFIISSDLSHFHDYKTCQELDKKTSSLIEELKGPELQSDYACGYYPVRGLLHLAKKYQLSAKTIDLRNSGDTAGDKASVVGYGGYIIY